MKTSEEYKQVISAIHEVQQELEVVKRDDKADIKTQKGDYSYKFAGMPTVWAALKPLLKKNKLTVIQSPSYDTGDFLSTTIYHESGEWLQDSMRLIVTREDPQGMGSAITFARRYALLAMFGIITDDDTDAATQRLADGEMKKEWVRQYTVIAKKNDSEKVVTQGDFISFMSEVYGKHPSKVLAKEHQNVLDTIKAFDS